MLRTYDEECLRAAIEQSAVAVKNGGMPFGAVLANQDGEILLRATNASVAGQKRGGRGDVTRHAEVEIIRQACDQIPMEERTHCTLYASTEPCVMCAGAVYWSGFGRLVFGCEAQELVDFTGPGGFDIPVRKLYGMGPPGMRPIEIHGPYLSEEAMAVHKSCGVWGSSPKGGGAQADIDAERALLESGLGAAAVATHGYSVPVIDMSKGTDEELAQELWNAATTVGFFTLINHGIPAQVVDDAFQASADFFAQPQDAKQEMAPFARHLNSGYEYMSQVRPSTGTADQKESLQITAREGCMDGRWPTTPADFSSKSDALMTASHVLACHLMTLLEPLACPILKTGTLVKSHNLWGTDGQCTLRFLHYPPMTAETARQLTTPDDDGRIFWRAGPHTDWDNLTLLFQRGAGLECCSNPKAKDAAAQWTPIDPIDNGIAVNIGDMLARWSDGQLYSNLHRVRMPTEAECTPPSSRYSIAFFAQADKSALIESKDSEPITAGDYIQMRIQSNFSK